MACGVSLIVFVMALIVLRFEAMGQLCRLLIFPSVSYWGNARGFYGGEKKPSPKGERAIR